MQSREKSIRCAGAAPLPVDGSYSESAPKRWRIARRHHAQWALSAAISCVAHLVGTSAPLGAKPSPKKPGSVATPKRPQGPAPAPSKLPPSFEALAQRFRIHAKFTVEGSRGAEKMRPCSWPWLYARSRLVGKKGKVLVGSAALARNPREILRHADLRHYARNEARDATLLPVHDKTLEGQAWSEVVKGAGFYAQVTRINERLYNLVYFTLYAYNKTTVTGDHKGDLTAVQLVYDRVLDRIVRVAFSIHGSVIEAFDLLSATSTRKVMLSGRGVDGKPMQTAAIEYTLPKKGRYQDGPWWHSPAKPVVYMVVDPKTGKPDHLATFIEWGAHEPWPNVGGSVTTAPKHTGDALSFTPRHVTLLGAADEAFTYYGGKLGNDPVAIARHRFWRGPSFGAPQTDRDPYAKLGPLAWPPQVPASTR